MGIRISQRSLIPIKNTEAKCCLWYCPILLLLTVGLCSLFQQVSGKPGNQGSSSADQPQWYPISYQRRSFLEERLSGCECGMHALFLDVWLQVFLILIFVSYSLYSCALSPQLLPFSVLQGTCILVSVSVFYLHFTAKNAAELMSSWTCQKPTSSVMVSCL